jgi:hypothetical protein
VRAVPAEVVVEVSAADNAGLARIFFSVNGCPSRARHSRASGRTARGSRFRWGPGSTTSCSGPPISRGTGVEVDDRLVYRTPGE